MVQPARPPRPAHAAASPRPIT